MYADDTAILSRHYNPNTRTQNINDHLAHLEIWFSVWKIALNTTKTEAVFFTQRRPPPEITLQNQRIPWSQHTKYLGVIIDKTSRSDNTLHTIGDLSPTGLSAPKFTLTYKTFRDVKIHASKLRLLACRRSSNCNDLPPNM
ncbi:RNA-directed DNA polymerase from mobile element jockey [Trichonephila clavipes]|nr:RNA-directed DNA polymerase from mobile element jockey [Trichonephila clavipes]